MHYIDILIIVTALLVSLSIAYIYKTNNKNLSSLFLGRGNIPWYIAGLSMVATTFSVDTPLAVTELTYTNGIANNWIWWSFLIGGLFNTFFFSKLWKRSHLITEVEFLTQRYSNPHTQKYRIFKALHNGLFQNSLIIAWINISMISILQVFFGLDYVNCVICLIILMVMALLYSSVSGLKGIVFVDVFQFILAMTGAVVILYVVIQSKEIQSIDHVVNTIHPSYTNFFFSLHNTDKAHSLQLSFGLFFSFIFVQWWSSIFPGSEPAGGGYIAQRIMSTKNEKHSVYASLLFQIIHYCIRPWPWIIVALCAIYLYSPEHNFSKQETEILTSIKNTTYSSEIEASMLHFANTERQKKSIAFMLNPQKGYLFIIQDFIPVGIMGLVLAGFLCAYLSTISTQLNLGSSYLVNDCIIPLGLLSRCSISYKNILMTGLIILVSLGIGTYFDSISDVWKFLISISSGAGLVLILRWLWWRVNLWGEISATISPILWYTLSKYYIEDYIPETFIENNFTFLFCVVMTTITWILCTLFTAPTSEEKLLQFYAKIRPMGFWKPIRNKIDTIKHENNSSEILQSIILWITSIIGLYALLFSIGYFLFGKAFECTISVGICILCLIIFLSKKRFLT